MWVLNIKFITYVRVPIFDEYWILILAFAHDLGLSHILGCVGFFQCISQRWFSVWASRWPAIGSTCTRLPTLHCGEDLPAPVRSSHFSHPTAELCSGSVLFFCRPPGSEQQVLNPWVTINLVVALLVGMAWIFIGFRPEKDFTEGQWEETTSDFRTLEQNGMRSSAIIFQHGSSLDSFLSWNVWWWFLFFLLRISRDHGDQSS